MQLRDYLDKEGLSAGQFARQLNVSHVSVSRWLHGRRVPNSIWMLRIMKATNGAVLPNDFYNLPGCTPKKRQGRASEIGE